jgi:hypothetical protein
VCFCLAFAAVLAVAAAVRKGQKRHVARVARVHAWWSVVGVHSCMRVNVWLVCADMQGPDRCAAAYAVQCEGTSALQPQATAWVRSHERSLHMQPGGSPAAAGRGCDLRLASSGSKGGFLASDVEGSECCWWCVVCNPVQLSEWSDFVTVAVAAGSGSCRADAFVYIATAGMVCVAFGGWLY